MKSSRHAATAGNFESGRDHADTAASETAGASDAERSRSENASANRTHGAGSHAPDASDAADSARCGAEKTGEEEIEVTQEMIAAGEDAICAANAELSPWVSYSDLAERVSRAMAALGSKDKRRFSPRT